MSNSRIVALCLAVMLAISPACSPDPVIVDQEFYTDISSGTGGQLNLHTVDYGTVERVVSSDVWFDFVGARAVVSDIKGGTLKEMRVKNQQEVTAGEVIAVLDVDYSKADLDNLKSSLEIAVRQLDIEKTRFTTAVSVATDALALLGETVNATPRDIRRAELRLEIATLDLQDFNRRRDERIAAAEKAIDDFEHNNLRTEIVAPISGMVVDLQIIQVGKFVGEYEFLCNIFPMSTMRIIGRVEQINTFRFNQLGDMRIANTPNVFPVRILSAPNVYGTSNGLFTAELDSSVDVNPNDLMEYARAQFNVTVPRFRLDNVMVVPQTAVQNENASFYVRVYEDGTVKKRFVVTGMSDGKNVQILDGLSVGQSVVLG